MGKWIYHSRRTRLGMELLKVRAETGESQGEMARRLEMHPAHLSGVERGRIAAPPYLFLRLEKEYGLDGAAMKRVEAAECKSAKVVCIRIGGATEWQRKAAALFREKALSLTDAQCKAIVGILQECGK